MSNDEYKNVLVFCDRYSIFIDWCHTNTNVIHINYSSSTIYSSNPLKRYHCIPSSSPISKIRGYNDVEILLLYGWNKHNEGDIISEIRSLLLCGGGKIIGEKKYVEQELWKKFAKMSRGESFEWLFRNNRFEFLDIR